MLDADNAFKDLQKQLDKLAEYNPKFFPETWGDDAILCDVLDEEGSETEDDTDDVSNEPICPQSSDVHQALHGLREYILFSDNGEFIQKYLNKISVLVENELSAKLRQTDMRSFFH